MNPQERDMLHDTNIHHTRMRRVYDMMMMMSEQQVNKSEHYLQLKVRDVYGWPQVGHDQVRHVEGDSE